MRKVQSRARPRHGSTSIQKRPNKGAATAINHHGMSGAARKSLKPMARYCLSSTATQKIGSEKNRNEMNVTP